MTAKELKRGPGEIWTLDLSRGLRHFGYQPNALYVHR